MITEWLHQRRVSRLLARRVVPVDGIIYDHIATNAIAQLLFLQAQDVSKPVTIRIVSPGGNTIAALALLEAIERLTPMVRTFSPERVGGVAVLLAAAGRKGERYAHPESRFILTPLTMPEAESHPEEIGRVRERLQALFETATGTETSFEGPADLSVTQAMEMGVVDQIVRNLPAV